MVRDTTYKCDFCGVVIDRRDLFDVVINVFVPFNYQKQRYPDVISGTITDGARIDLCPQCYYDKFKPSWKS